ncbi:hypothetical protein PFICI_05886 [Pestalotiopsis fici W106-1]|uniref:Uncharacterized protein n=1 Tax=Pestalotiopsis fici (strain W106-1 / CGMCC3.15140) TaxID=1229662 RepID=W3XD79_PESFW|nr:uncharacterized protein PFICI_05886 [Pestalotiopsis fici W106-1]ETS84010.1 hypothetical protein PFICI_05886 [Pestalotiopsis fici W106-1]
MDTINSIAKTAANAVWGPNTTDGKEPVSGHQGDVSKGEPYDKGNIEGAHSSVNTTGESTPNTTSAAAPTSAAGNTTGPSTTSVTEGSKDAEFAKTTGTAAESSEVPDNERTELKAKDTPSDTTTGQNDTRDPTNPQTNPKNNPTDVDDTAAGPTEGQKLDGPGPKPLDEVAKEHGGDAGNSDAALTSSEGNTEGKAATESDDPNDPHAPSKGEGTGEKYIKSTGMAADGGDFDAANAGAGREADRLMEEKGIHTSKDAPKGEVADDKHGSPESEEKKKKPGVVQKIKAKLSHH